MPERLSDRLEALAEKAKLPQTCSADGPPNNRIIWRRRLPWLTRDFGFFAGEIAGAGKASCSADGILVRSLSFYQKTNLTVK